MANTADEYIELYNKILELYPEDWLANSNLGYGYLQAEEYDKAKERFEVNMQNNPDGFGSYVLMAHIYMARGLYDKARKILETYLNNSADHANVYLYLAGNYLCQGRYDLALVEVDKAFSLNPSYYYIIQTKGDIYHCKGDLIEAEKEYQKLLKEEEKAAQLMGRYRLGVLYLLQARFEESKKQLKQGMEVAKRLGDSEWNIIFHLYSAYLYLKSENHEQALQTLKECEKLLSSASPVMSLGGRRTALALYIKGYTYIEMKSIDEAQKAADELKALVEKGIYKKLMRFYYHLMGLIELERQNSSDAIEYFKKALSLLPSQYFDRRVLKLHEHALFIEPLALVYLKTGELEKAREEYEKITSLTIGRLYFGDIYAKSFYMLGKIFEQKSRKGKAIEHYAKILDLWKDADPGIPEVTNAKERLSSLRAQ